MVKSNNKLDIVAPVSQKRGTELYQILGGHVSAPQFVLNVKNVASLLNKFILHNQKVWKCVAPTYLRELCVPVEDVRGRPRLRSALTCCISLHASSSDLYWTAKLRIQRTCGVEQSHTSLALNMSLAAFKSKLKTYLFSRSQWFMATRSSCGVLSWFRRRDINDFTYLLTLKNKKPLTFRPCVKLLGTMVSTSFRGLHQTKLALNSSGSWHHDHPSCQESSRMYGWVDSCPRPDSWLPASMMKASERGRNVKGF